MAGAAVDVVEPSPRSMTARIGERALLRRERSQPAAPALGRCAGALWRAAACGSSRRGRWRLLRRLRRRALGAKPDGESRQQDERSWRQKSLRSHSTHLDDWVREM